MASQSVEIRGKRLRKLRQADGLALPEVNSAQRPPPGPEFNVFGLCYVLPGKLLLAKAASLSKSLEIDLSGLAGSFEADPPGREYFGSFEAAGQSRIQYRREGQPPVLLEQSDRNTRRLTGFGAQGREKFQILEMNRAGTEAPEQGLPHQLDVTGSREQGASAAQPVFGEDPLPVRAQLDWKYQGFRRIHGWSPQQGMPCAVHALLPRTHSYAAPFRPVDRHSAAAALRVAAGGEGIQERIGCRVIHLADRRRHRADG